MTQKKKNYIVGIISESNYLLLVIPKSRSSFTIIQVLQGISEPLQIGLSNSSKKQQREKLRERERRGEWTNRDSGSNYKTQCSKVN